MVRTFSAFLAALALAGCATTDIARVVSPGMERAEALKRAGKPTLEGPGYADYSRQPWGYYRVSFSDERVKEVRDLHNEANFRRLEPGMTEKEVVETIGVTSWFEGYATGTSWRYRYRDAGIAKLLHVIFDQNHRVAWFYWEWDPDVYSKGGPTGERM